MNLSSISPPLIVIGMHRSGTSMLSRVLRMFGVHMGANLSENAECLLFQAVNRAILSRHGGRWDLVRPVLDAFRSREVVDREAVRLERELIAGGRLAETFTRRQRLLWSLGGRPERWGWKDPRNSITLPAWLRVFPGARVVHVVRNGIDVAISLHRRELKAGSANPDAARNIDEFAGYLRLWEDYVRACREHRSTLPNGGFREVRYERVLADPRRELGALLEFLAIDVRPDTVAGVARSIDASRLGNDALRRKFGEQIAALPASAVMDELGYR